MSSSCIHFCLNTISAFTGNPLVAGNDATSDTRQQFSVSNAYIQFGCIYASTHLCFTTKNTGNGNALDAGKVICIQAMTLHPIPANNISSSNICIQFGYIYASIISFCFSAIIAGTENTLDTGNDAVTNTCKQVCTKLWVIL